jgi:hypothetical protein
MRGAGIRACQVLREQLHQGGGSYDGKCYDDGQKGSSPPLEPDEFDIGVFDLLKVRVEVAQAMHQDG